MDKPYLITALFHIEHVSNESLARLGVDKQTKMTKLVYAESFEEATHRLGGVIIRAAGTLHKYDNDRFARVVNLTYTNETLQ